MALVVMMAVIVIAIPTTTMIGCDMAMGGGMPFMPTGTGIYNGCVGEWATTSGPSGVVPSGLQSLLMALSVAVVAVAVTLAPRETSAPARIPADEPPPPPEDPLGQRTRI
jgi:hypothetical protein